MKLWVVYYWEYADMAIAGIYDTEAQAVEVKNALNAEFSRGLYQPFDVEEMELNAPLELARSRWPFIQK